MEKRFENFSGSILELNRCLGKIKELVMQEYGLRSKHTMFLYYLGQNPQGLTSKEIADCCKEDKAAVSRNLAALLEKDLIKYEDTDKNSVYRVKLLLTEKGIEVAQKINDRVSDALDKCGEGLSEEQRNNFYASMETIRSNLVAYIEQF